MRILLSAYACAPGMGSEPGVGWSWSRELARRGHEVTVMTVGAKADCIRQHLANSEGPKPDFVFVDFRRWPKLGDGVWPRLIRLHYFFWQLAAARQAARLHAAKPFDCVHHLTWGSIRLPTFMWRVGAPLIFGPLGGGERSPKPLRRAHSVYGKLFEWARDFSNATVRLNPMMRTAFRRARLVIARTEESARLVTAARSRVHIQQELAVHDLSDLARARHERTVPTSPVIVFAGRLVHLKGIDLAIRAFAQFRRAHHTGRFLIHGDGPERSRLEALAVEQGVADAVEFRGKVDQHELFALFRRSSVFLFPSLHDSGGTVVLEALANGLPVICLDCGGPKCFVDAQCGRVVPAFNRSADRVVADLGRALSEILLPKGRVFELSAGCFDRAEQFELGRVVERLYGRAGFTV